MSALSPILAQFASEPSFVEPALQDRFEACVNKLLSSEHADQMLSAHGLPMMAEDSFWPAPESWEARYRPYVVVAGVLQIPVKGVLLNNFPYAFGAWATGYEYIWRAYQRGMDDSTVRGIALVIDSPGGIVAGNFDLVDRMYQRRDEKPVRAFAHESAYSAAYSIASVAKTIIVSRTGGVGSIGVVTAHVDASEAYKQMGLKITFIHAGKHKVDGNSSEPLPKAVRDRIQVRIDELYDVFVSTVARNRPQLSEKQIRDTEAQCFTATQSISEGLADSIGSLDDALSAFAGDLDDNGDEEMADQNSAVDQTAAITAAREEGRTAGLSEGATAERGRINTILASDEAKDRPKAALSAALKTNMSADEAKGFLADLPKEAAVKTPPQTQGKGTTFDEAMERSGNPDLAQNDSNDAGGGQPVARTEDEQVDDIFGNAGFAPRKTV